MPCFLFAQTVGGGKDLGVKGLLGTWKGSRKQKGIRKSNQGVKMTKVYHMDIHNETP